MNFENGNYFYWLLVILPLMITMFLLAKKRRKKLLATVLGQAYNDTGVINVSYGRRVVRFWLLLGAVTMILIAITRPWWGSIAIPYSTNGRDILVLFDVSKSMLASDVAPSRLEHAKFILEELVNDNKGDRFGLAAFAGDSFLMCPLTSDKNSFIQYIKELSPESIPVGGTNIQRALTVAESSFEASESNFRAILMITDGDELSGDSNKILEQLKAKNIPLFIIGLGDPDLPALIPDGKGGYQRDASGELAKSRLAEAQLKNLALSTGGVYVRTTAAETGLNVIEQRIERLIKRDTGNGVRSIPIERFPYFLSAAAILLLGFFLLGERKTVVTSLAFILCLNLLNAEPLPEQTITKEVTPIELYNQALNLQKSQNGESQTLYQEAIKKSTHEPQVRSRSFFNLAVENQRKAQKTLEQAKQLLNAQQLDNAEKTLKNTQKELENSQELYQQALSIPDQNNNPINPGQNLQLMFNKQNEVKEILKKIEELKKQQQEAQKQTQQAKDQQQQQQDNNQQQQDNNQQQMQNALDSAKALEKKAQELNQEELSKSAQKAQEEIKKAQDAEKEKNHQASKEFLEKALKELGANENKNKDKENSQDKDSDQNKENQDKEDKEDKGNEQSQGNEQLPQNNSENQAQQQEQPQQGKLDKASAEQLLKMMADQEQELRDAIRAQMQNRQIKVEKDW